MEPSNYSWEDLSGIANEFTEMTVKAVTGTTIEEDRWQEHRSILSSHPELGSYFPDELHSYNNSKDYRDYLKESYDEDYLEEHIQKIMEPMIGYIRSKLSTYEHQDVKSSEATPDESHFTGESFEEEATHPGEKQEEAAQGKEESPQEEIEEIPIKKARFEAPRKERQERPPKEEKAKPSERKVEEEKVEARSEEKQEAPPKEEKVAERPEEVEETPAEEAKEEAPPEEQQETSSEEEEEQKPERKPENKNLALHGDNPAAVDQLERKPFVKALHIYLQRLWKEREDNDAYVIHINGEWGSGKSTVLSLLKERLENMNGTENGKNQENKKPWEKEQDQWIVVEFNAWQNQHIEEPWWIFLDEVYRTIKEKSPDRAREIGRKENWWRLCSMNRVKWIATLALLLVFVVTLIAGLILLSDKDFNYNKTLLAITISAFSLMGSVWLFLNNVVNSLLPGSESAAKNYRKQVSDPMEKIKQHYIDVINYTEKNVAVFIDDIDRCEPVFVVRLLEGLQTLFRTQKVLYVIAGDSAWIRQSFELHYDDLKDTISKHGQSLGNFFVEKSLQQTVNLPPITKEIKEAYWKWLLQDKKNGIDKKDLEEQQKKLEEKFADSIKKIYSANNEQELDQVISEVNDVDEKNILRKKAAEKVSSEKILEDIEHELLKYHVLLEPNPRTMKRLVNNLALEKASNYLSGLNEKVDNESLVHWAILKSRFPTYAYEITHKRSKYEEYKNTKEYPEVAKILSEIKSECLEFLKA